MTRPSTPPLITSLQIAGIYNHPVDKFELIETHISWVLLTGPFAYKIKKPVNLGFVDFSTLEKRRHYCEEELRLNRRLAPSLYLGLVAISGSPDRPELNGTGPVLEYAVKMKQFDRDQEVDKVLARNGLSKSDLDRLAADLVEFHHDADVARPESLFGTPERIEAPMKDNFSEIKSFPPDRSESALLVSLERWVESRLKELRTRILERKAKGFVRECHGDLHLANMVLIDGRITVFDCLEFNENLRFIDVISDLAFLLMDLDKRGHADLANRFLNRYLAGSGDYEGLSLLRLYKVYRSMVRAKVAAIRLGQRGLDGAEAKALNEERAAYLRLAEGYTGSSKGILFITSGLSGSGKSALAEQLSEVTGAIWIRTDLERKREEDLIRRKKEKREIEGGIYSAERTLRTYRRLNELAGFLLQQGFPVVLDGTFLRAEQRKEAIGLAERMTTPALILYCEAPETELRRRVTEREREGKDPSEADVNVLEWQMKQVEPFDAKEQIRVLRIHTGEPVKITELIGRVRRKIESLGKNERSRE